MSALLSYDVSFDAIVIVRPRCPRCHLRMTPVGISAGVARGAPRHFECPTCNHMADDPMKSSAAGWLNGDLKPPE
jgi:hypothetical protein